jgi:hypothetical protein
MNPIATNYSLYVMLDLLFDTWWGLFLENYYERTIGIENKLPITILKMIFVNYVGLKGQLYILK